MKASQRDAANALRPSATRQRAEATPERLNGV